MKLWHLLFELNVGHYWVYACAKFLWSTAKILREETARLLWMFHFIWKKNKNSHFLCPLRTIKLVAKIYIWLCCFLHNIRPHLQAVCHLQGDRLQRHSARSLSSVPISQNSSWLKTKGSVNTLRGWFLQVGWHLEIEERPARYKINTSSLAERNH